MKIRKAKKEDLKGIMGLSYRLFSKFEKLDNNHKLIKSYFGSKKQYHDFSKEIKKTTNCFFIAEIDKKIVGCLSINIFDNYPMYQIRKKGHFDLLIIHPEYRDKGIGKKLINEGYKWFKEKGIKNFTVTTHALDKEASKFWKHQGFNEYNIKYEK